MLILTPCMYIKPPTDKRSLVSGFCHCRSFSLSLARSGCFLFCGASLFLVGCARDVFKAPVPLAKRKSLPRAAPATPAPVTQRQLSHNQRHQVTRSQCHITLQLHNNSNDFRALEINSDDDDALRAFLYSQRQPAFAVS
jgi:hypothetical protein